MDIFGLLKDGVQKRPLSLKSVSHILQWWNMVQLYITYIISKSCMSHVTHVLSYADLSFFHKKPAKFAISRNTYTDSVWYTISNTFWVFKNFFKRQVTTLMMSAKMVALGLLKIKKFWNNNYDVIIFVHDVNKNILSCDSSYLTKVW